LTAEARNYRVRRSALGAMVLMALVGLTLNAPSHVAACMCVPQEQGQVVFTGTVVDSPNGSVFFQEFEIPKNGVYTFDVESVTRGDALDGRVYTGPGNCASAFLVGATYRVHARMVAADEDWMRGPPDVPLATGMCMANELLEPANPLIALSAMALSPRGMILIVGGLAVAAAAAIYLRRRMSSHGFPRRRRRRGRELPHV
jgi:hypothetical protein